MNKRLIRVLAAALVVAMALLAGCSTAKQPAANQGGQGAQGGQPQPAQKPQDHVIFRLDWLPRGDYAPLFVAVEKGYFADEGIVIDNIVNGDGSVNAVKLVGSGEFTFGQADAGTVVSGRVKGIPVKSILMRNQNSPMAWVSLKSSNITKPKDVEGRTFGVQPSGSTYIFYQVFAKLQGVDRSKVKEVTVSVPYENFLVEKKVDVVNGYIDAEVPELEAKTGGPGSLNIIVGSQYGYKAYGTAIITSDKVIKEKPDLVKRFVRAYKKGFEYTVKNPDEAVDILLKHRPEAKKDVMKIQLAADIKYTFQSDDTKAHGLGWQTAQGWAQTQQNLFDTKVIDKKVDVNELFTDDFLQ